MKTVRIRSLTGEQLIVPNHDLLQSRIRNFQRLHQTPRPVQLHGVSRRAARKTGGHARRGEADHRIARRRPLRTGPPSSVWRLWGAVRSGISRSHARLQPLHGHPAGRQPGTAQADAKPGLAIAYQKGLLGPTARTKTSTRRRLIKWRAIKYCEDRRSPDRNFTRRATIFLRSASLVYRSFPPRGSLPCFVLGSSEFCRSAVFC